LRSNKVLTKINNNQKNLHQQVLLVSTLGEEGNQLESAGLKGAGAQGKLGCRKCACEKGCALKGARAPTSGKQLWSGKSHWTTNLPGLAAVPALLFAFLGWLALAENFLPSPLFQPSAGLALGGATFLSGLALPTQRRTGRGGLRNC